MKGTKKQVDAFIIGAGQAGPSLARRLANAGMSVALAERKLFGGTCVNTGCMPSKTLIASARAAHVARRAQDFGVMLGSKVQVDWAKVKARVDAVVTPARRGVEASLRDLRGCTVLEGHARFEGPRTVRVGSETFTAERIFINTGGRAIVPSFPGIERVPYRTNASIFNLERVPEHLVVVGGSYVGLELAQAFRRLGAQVTVVEKSARILSREDEDISQALYEILSKEGVAIRTGAECIRLARHERGVKVSVTCEEGAPEVMGTEVLLAVGRRPNTDELGLDAAGVLTDERGFIKVDDQLATNVPGIWALGECNGHGAFTHTAYNDYEILAANLLDDDDRKLSARVPGYALFTDPPLGRTGMTETQARQSGRPLLLGKRPMSRVGRAVEKDETQGFMKIIADAETKQILGAAILGIGGDEAIHGVLDIMSARVPYPELQWAVPIHPTVSELLPTLLGGMEPAS